MKHTLKPDQIFNGHFELFENEFPKMCPYQNPMMITTKLNPNPVPMYKGCGTWCALFEIHNRERNAGEQVIKSREALISCSGATVRIELPDEEKPVSGLKLL